jgi:hypothetical protein
MTKVKVLSEAKVSKCYPFRACWSLTLADAEAEQTFPRTSDGQVVLVASVGIAVIRIANLMDKTPVLKRWWFVLQVLILVLLFGACFMAHLTRDKRFCVVARARIFKFFSYVLPIAMMLDIQLNFAFLVGELPASWYVTHHAAGWDATSIIISHLNSNRLISFVFPFFSIMIAGERIVLAMTFMLVHLLSKSIADERAFASVETLCLTYALALAGLWTNERQKKRRYFLLKQAMRAVEELTQSKHNFVSALPIYHLMSHDLHTLLLGSFFCPYHI